MKKILFSAAVLALAFFAGSCQRENLEPVAANGTVTYTVLVPGAIATKTDDGVNNVDKLVYEVYRTVGEKVTAFSDADHCLYHREAEVKDGKAEIALELVNDQNFTVLFWAYDSSTNVYDVDDLTNVTIASTVAANTHKTAAFTGVDFVVNCVSDQGGNVKLTRPVAQLNIATTTESLKMDDTDITVSESYVKVYGLSTSFNVAKQEAGVATGDMTYTQAAVLGGAVTVAAKEYPCLAMNYLGFIPTEGASVKVDYLLKTSEGDIDNTIENVPVKPNYRTNIVGNLISGTQDYNVTLDAEWAEETLQVGNAAVSTAEGLQESIDRVIPGVPATITLEGNIDLSALAGTLSTKAGSQSPGLKIPAGKSVTLDLNGYTLSQELECAGSYSMIVNNGTLTVTGNGKVSFKDLSTGGGSTWGSYTINNYGILIVENGTIEHLGDASLKNNTNIPIQNYAGKVVVNDGIISSPTFRSLRDFTAGGEIIINGGQFLGQVWMQGLGTGSSSLTINGGEFNPTAPYDGSSVYITNGANDVMVSITGGTFNTKIGCADSTKSGVKGCVTGGQFKVDPSNYVADGCYALKYDDEEYYRIYDNFDPEHRTFTVNSKEELLRLSDLSAKWADFFSNGEGTEYSNYAEQNGGKGTDFYYNWTWTIKLTVDIDFEGETIEPIDLGKRKCFDGQGHTIKNAKIETSSDAGLFNAAQCGLKNLVIENVQVKTSDNGATAGILASSCNAGVENITIRNSSVYGGKYTGAVVGYGYTDVTNCTLTGCTVHGCYKCGGIIGYICASNDQTRKVDNNTLTDCTVDFTGTLTEGKSEFVCGMVVGNYNCDGTCSNNTIDNMTTVATGLIGRTEAGKNVTVTVKVATPEALTDALASGANVTLTEDVKTEAATTAPYGNKYAFKLDGGVLDGQGNELYMECYGDDYGIMTSGGTVKNLTITEACRAIMIMYPTQDIVLDNVKIGGDGVLYPINTGEAGSEGVNLIVTNSVLAGWTSFSNIESASFTNVEFKQGTYYDDIYGRVLKPYVNTTLTDCAFVEHMNLDLSGLANGHKITISNCTVNGQTLTAEVFTVPSTDAEYDTALFTIDLPSWAGSVTDCVVFE